MASQTQEPFSLLERLKHISSWFRAKKAVALCLRLQKRYRTCPNKKTGTKGEEEDVKKPNANTEDLQDAEMEIIKSIQKEEFQDEICFLRSLEAHDDLNDRAAVGAVKKSSNLHKYDPFLDANGILRIGGRLKHADLSSDVKHPVILPKKGHVTDLIISHHHDSVEHQGRGITRNNVRFAGFQIVGEGSAVSNHIAQCVPCRRMRRPVEQQKMADLPEDRVQPSPPFSYCAVDYFGPWYIREGRRELKRYGVLFTCLASRAVHIEVSHSMTTDSFINAYRRFVGRRGPVRQMRSDQGTNFVGAKNELQRALSELDNGKIKEELLKRNCDWVVFKMNVPHASHMGGVWERQIRTVRSVLTALLNSNGSQLNDESLHTFMVEAESIVNCRPLTVADVSSPDGVRALTPNHLLTMKSSVVLPPPGSFQRADLYLTKRWRRVQYLVNEFWNKWKGDFLQSLQSRQKWGQIRRNMMVGDIVIVKDENLPRNQWQLARVVQTYPGDDGLVRKVMITVADPALSKDGKRVKPPVSLERPIQKLVLLIPHDGLETRESPSRSQMLGP